MKKSYVWETMEIFFVEAWNNKNRGSQQLGASSKFKKISTLCKTAEKNYEMSIILDIKNFFKKSLDFLYKIFIIYTATREIKKRIPATKIVLTALWAKKGGKMKKTIRGRPLPVCHNPNIENENPVSVSSAAAVDHSRPMIRGPSHQVY